MKPKAIGRAGVNCCSRACPSHATPSSSWDSPAKSHWSRPGVCSGPTWCTSPPRGHWVGRPCKRPGSCVCLLPPTSEPIFKATANTMASVGCKNPSWLTCGNFTTAPCAPWCRPKPCMTSSRSWGFTTFRWWPAAWIRSCSHPTNAAPACAANGRPMTRPWSSCRWGAWRQKKIWI